MVTEGSAGSNQSQDKIPKLFQGKKHGKATNNNITTEMAAVVVRDFILPMFDNDFKNTRKTGLG